MSNDNIDNKAFYNLTYGIFLLSTEYEGARNACIINTCIQVASNPSRLLISCINSNYTTELLKKAKKFSISVIDNISSFDFISNFGLSTGRERDKFKSFSLLYNTDNIPYIVDFSSSLFFCHVVDFFDLTSHTAFVAEIDEAKVLSKNPPLTYNDYQTKLKPKNKLEKRQTKIIGWRCKICGYVYDGENLPDDYLCPLCSHPASDFEPMYETDDH